MNRALTYKYEADGYAYLGTFSVTIIGRDIAMPLLNAEGDRPDDARELAWDIATTLNLLPEMLEALEATLELLSHHYDAEKGRYHSLDRPGGETDADCKICQVAGRVGNILTRIKGEPTNV